MHPEHGMAGRTRAGQGVELDLVSRDAVREEQVARAVQGRRKLGRGDAGPETQHGGAGVDVGPGLVDLQLAVAWVEDEGVGAAVALLVVLRPGRRPLPVEQVGVLRAADRVGARRRRRRQGQELLARPGGAVGELHLLHPGAREA